MEPVSDPPFDQATLRYYSDEAPVYAAAGKDGVSRFLHDFLDRLLPGARILDLGCGGGRDSEAMLNRGFMVDATDGVEAIALQAEARIGRPVLVMRFDELTAIATYDAIWANASLLHVPTKHLPTILSAVKRALKPGGLHFASYKSGGREGRDGFGRYFNYLSAVQLEAAYEACGGWDVIDCLEYEGGGYDGRLGPWAAIIVRKRGTR